MMSTNEPRTCGKGLAERSAFPARLSALSAAMVDVLEQHQQTLDLSDDNAREEHTAYQLLASDYRNITTQLRTTADRMAAYRDLPMARHHAHATIAPEIRRALTTLVQRERDLAALLKTWIEQDEAMLVVSKESS
jgi:oligoribonuclease (3'-5' exoribonuclease)